MNSVIGQRKDVFERALHPPLPPPSNLGSEIYCTLGMGGRGCVHGRVFGGTCVHLAALVSLCTSP